MEQSEFWKLFAETGEPVYWLLCRAENAYRPQNAARPADCPKENGTPPAPQ